MMQTLRNYMKHILWVVALAFIVMLIFSWGMGGFKNRGSEAEQGIIGIVNGQKIQYRQFLLALEQQIENVKSQTGAEEINEFQLNSIRERLWQNTVREILYFQEIKRLDIQATTEEIVYYLRNNPPEMLRNYEQFQTDGEFDPNKYQQALTDPNFNDFWIQAENYLRTTIPLQKLENLPILTVRVTDSDLLKDYKLRNEKVNTNYIYINPDSVSLENIQVTESQITSYYNENKMRYREVEKRKIKYVLFDTKPSVEDSIQTLQDAKYIYNEILQGADFEEMAKEYSKDPGSAQKGGDLGFFGKGTMVKPFEDAAFSAKVGELIGPIKTVHGLHIIQVMNRKREDGELKVHARHILLDFKASPETIDNRNDRAHYFHEEIMRMEGKGFEELANREGLSIKETSFFTKGRYIPDIGIAPRANFKVFEEKVGWVSEPFGSGNNLFIFQISEIQKDRFKPLEEVESDIEQILQKQKQKEKAGEICRSVWERINSGMDFMEARHLESVEVGETGYFALTQYIPAVGRDAKYNGTAFRLKINEISEPLDCNRGYYILQVTDKTTIDEESFVEEKENLREELLKQKRQNALNAWSDELMKKADIKDFRQQYF